MDGIEDALAIQEIINRAVYKRFGYEMNEAKRMQEEYAQRH